MYRINHRTSVLTDAELLFAHLSTESIMPLYIASFLHWMHIVNSVVQIQPYFVQSKTV